MLYDVGKYGLPTKWFQPLQDKSMDKELLQHHITLNSETRTDLRWCLDFLPSWKGSSPLVELDWTHWMPHLLVIGLTGKEDAFLGS